jgi:hypothetical protein
MRTASTAMLDIRMLDDGSIRARRKDKTLMTEADHAEACRVVEGIPGIIPDVALRIFGGRVLSAEEEEDSVDISETDLDAIAAERASWRQDDQKVWRKVATWKQSKQK